MIAPRRAPGRGRADDHGSLRSSRGPRRIAGNRAQVIGGCDRAPRRPPHFLWRVSRCAALLGVICPLRRRRLEHVPGLRRHRARPCDFRVGARLPASARWTVACSSSTVLVAVDQTAVDLAPSLRPHVGVDAGRQATDGRTGPVSEATARTPAATASSICAFEPLGNGELGGRRRPCGRRGRRPARAAARTRPGASATRSCNQLGRGRVGHRQRLVGARQRAVRCSARPSSSA